MPGVADRVLLIATEQLPVHLEMGVQVRRALEEAEVLINIDKAKASINAPQDNLNKASPIKAKINPPMLIKRDALIP